MAMPSRPRFGHSLGVLPLFFASSGQCWRPRVLLYYTQNVSFLAYFVRF